MSRLKQWLDLLHDPHPFHAPPGFPGLTCPSCGSDDRKLVRVQNAMPHPEGGTRIDGFIQIQNFTNYYCVNSWHR